MSSTLALNELPEAMAERRRSALRRFIRQPVTLIAVVVIVVIVVTLFLCFGAPPFLPYNDTFIDLRARYAAPLSGPHLLGSDELGRDLLARLLMVGRISLSVGLSAMVISMAIGTLVGVVAA